MGWIIFGVVATLVVAALYFLMRGKNLSTGVVQGGVKTLRNNSRYIFGALLVLIGALLLWMFSDSLLNYDSTEAKWWWPLVAAAVLGILYWVWKSKAWIVLIIIALVSLSAYMYFSENEFFEGGSATANYSKCNSKRVPAIVGQGFTLKSDCPVFFDVSKMKNGIDIFALDADISAANISKWDATHVGARNFELRLDPVASGFVGSDQVSMVVVKIGASGDEVEAARKVARAHRDKEISTALAATAAKAIAEAK